MLLSYWTILLLGIYYKKTILGICAQKGVFKAILCNSEQMDTWCPSIGKWLTQLRNSYIAEYYASAKNKMGDFCWMKKASCQIIRVIIKYNTMFYKNPQQTVIYVSTGTKLFIKSHGGPELCCPVWWSLARENYLN